MRTIGLGKTTSRARERSGMYERSEGAGRVKAGEPPRSADLLGMTVSRTRREVES